jgi:hypothetical protein
MSKPTFSRYRLTNWSNYDDALRRRGSLLIWLDKDRAGLRRMKAERGAIP